MKRDPVWLMLLAVLTFLLAACGGADSAQNEAIPTAVPTPIVPETPTYVVQRGEVVRQIEFTARVAPIDETRLFFRNDGYVQTVAVTKGDIVQAGDVLAELDVAALRRSLERARHDLQVAQEQLAEAEQAHQDDLARATLALATAQARLDVAETKLADDLARARANLAIKRQQLARARAQDPSPKRTKAEAELEQARITLQQAQGAYDAIAWRNDIAASAEAAVLQQATLEYDKAQAIYDLALQEIEAHPYDVAILQQEVATAQLEAQRLEQSEVDFDLQAAVALAQLEMEILERGLDPQIERAATAAQFELDDLEAQLKEARIIATLDGEVVSLAVAPGRAVEAFKPVIIVADSSGLEISAQLSAEQMRELSEGQEVSLLLANYPGQALSGVIRQLPYPYGSGGGSETLENADTTTRISLDFASLPAGVVLETGDLVQAIVVLERRQDVLWLPPAAIRTFSGRQFVVVQDGAVQRRVDVVLGSESKQRVEVKSGVQEGQMILGQ
ncbi:MAG: HlyD family efflux transporter periplasmic adaptor subunit [Anaerolineae bacterium]